MTRRCQRGALAAIAVCAVAGWALFVLAATTDTFSDASSLPSQELAHLTGKVSALETNATPARLDALIRDVGTIGERLNRAEAAANMAPSAAAVGDLSARLAAAEATAAAQLGAAAVATSALDQRVLRLEDAGGVAVLAADLDATAARHAALAAETTHAASATAAEIADLAQRMEAADTAAAALAARLDHVEYAADLLEAGDVGPLVAHVGGLASRVATLEAAAAAAASSAATGSVGHDHLPPVISTFPHTWTRVDNTLPEEFLAVELPAGEWRFTFESACLGDLSSCPRPGAGEPDLFVRDMAAGPSYDADRYVSGSLWCYDFQLDGPAHWRLWIADATGVTWSLTVAADTCPDSGWVPSAVF